MAHVYAHVDFFKNNFCFRLDRSRHRRSTVDPARRRKDYDPNRRWIDKMANHGSRMRGTSRAKDQQGRGVHRHCLSLENLIDPHAPFNGRRPMSIARRRRAAKAIEIPRLRAKDYMESFINPADYLEEQRKKIEPSGEDRRKFPEQPERDVLRFLLEHAPLERWEHDVLEVIREEAYYFVPQCRRKS